MFLPQLANSVKCRSGPPGGSVLRRPEVPGDGLEDGSRRGRPSRSPDHHVRRWTLEKNRQGGWPGAVAADRPRAADRASFLAIGLPCPGSDQEYSDLPSRHPSGMMSTSRRSQEDQPADDPVHAIPDAAGSPRPSPQADRPIRPLRVPLRSTFYSRRTPAKASVESPPAHTATIRGTDVPWTPRACFRFSEEPKPWIFLPRQSPSSCLA
jgi:hypothetical protein